MAHPEFAYLGVVEVRFQNKGEDPCSDLSAGILATTVDRETGREGQCKYAEKLVGLCWRATRSNEGEGRVSTEIRGPFR